jgi:hypothetical protein
MFIALALPGIVLGNALPDGHGSVRGQSGLILDQGRRIVTVALVYPILRSRN